MPNCSTQVLMHLWLQIQQTVALYLTDQYTLLPACNEI